MSDRALVKRVAEAIGREMDRQAHADGPSPWADTDDLEAAKLDGDFNLVEIAKAAIAAGVEPEQQ